MQQHGSDPHDLSRFLEAQQPVISRVREELQAGKKLSHWMWFVFPQLRQLGRSPNAKFYGIASLVEAAAYLEHPVLGLRLLECTDLVNAVQGRTAHQIFGSPDDIKFRSCMALFSLAGPTEARFSKALAKFYAGVPDTETLRLIGAR